MKALRIIALLALGSSLVTCCSQKQEPRRPISHSSGEFMKQSVERNKKLNNSEEKLIAAIIKKDTASHYIASPRGYWYFYNQKSTQTSTSKPTRGDIVYFDYEIKDLEGNIIYTKEELKPQKYAIDKQPIIIGLRDGIKQMQKGEKVTFLFPSHLAFGYHGDDNKVGSNKPIICTVTLNDVKKEIASTTTEVKQE